MVDVPDELHDLLQKVIQDRDNMKTVGDAFDPINLLLTVNDTDSDVVIMAHAEAERMPGICTHLLSEYPDLLILILSTKNSRAFLYEREITQEEISYKTPEDLITRISEVFSTATY